MRFVSLVFSVLVCQLVGILGSLVTMPAISGWYENLKKPAFSPPNWLFGPVWVLLYAFMGVALWLVWQKGWENKAVKTALVFFAVQLALNSLWSFLFFGYQNPFFALIEIIILWVMIFLTLKFFFQISPPAGWLLLPYLLWVSFAAILNFFLWRLN